MTVIENVVIKVGIDASGVTGVLQGLANLFGRSFAPTSGRLDDMSAALTDVSFAQKGVVKNGISLARKLSDVNRGAVESASNMLDFSKKVGLTTELLSEMRFVAAQAGVGYGTLAGGLENFARGLGEAESPTSNFAKLLKELDIDPKIDGKLKDTVSGQCLLRRAVALARAGAEAPLSFAPHPP